VIFKQHSTVISIKQLTLKISKHSHNIHRAKTVRNVTDWPTVSNQIKSKHICKVP